MLPITIIRSRELEKLKYFIKYAVFTQPLNFRILQTSVHIITQSVKEIINLTHEHIYNASEISYQLIILYKSSNAIQNFQRILGHNL